MRNIRFFKDEMFSILGVLRCYSNGGDEIPERVLFLLRLLMLLALACFDKSDDTF